MDDSSLSSENGRLRAEQFIEHIPDYPGGFGGRGIVICAGGAKYFPGAWVCLNMLRRLGCTLPIQMWHLGEEEINAPMRELLRPYNVACVDALQVPEVRTKRIIVGWELKAYALLHCAFREVLLLDADNVPIVDPTFLFDTLQYRSTGAIFWPDYGRLPADHRIWEICGVEYRDEPEFESGQIVVNKETAWRALCLAGWYNEHSDFFYRHVLGDKETFHLAFRKLDVPYAMPATPIRRLRGTMCQHDFEGRRIFQHRNFAKWNLIANQRIPGFIFEQECLSSLEDLMSRWDALRR